MIKTLSDTKLKQMPNYAEKKSKIKTKTDKQTTTKKPLSINTEVIRLWGVTLLI